MVSAALDELGLGYPSLEASVAQAGSKGARDVTKSQGGMMAGAAEAVAAAIGLAALPVGWP